MLEKQKNTEAPRVQKQSCDLYRLQWMKHFFGKYIEHIPVKLTYNLRQMINDKKCLNFCLLITAVTLTFDRYTRQVFGFFFT